MATDDTVNGISAENTILDFQPAAGVQVIITDVTDFATGHQLYNGTTATIGAIAVTGATQIISQAPISLGINNTRYLRLPATAATYKSYSGVTL